MRAIIFQFLFITFFGLLILASFTGFWFWFMAFIWMVFFVLSVGYPDSALLFFLGAREVKSTDEDRFHTAAVQEAYKLALRPPKVFLYNGSVERGFVIESHRQVSLVINRDLINLCTEDELAAICFELLLQVKKNMASKRTRATFLIGLFSWFISSLCGVINKLIPIKEVRQSINSFNNFLLRPWYELAFKLMIGENYFRKLEMHLADFPQEGAALQRLGDKLRRPEEIKSFTSKKILELTSSLRSQHFQNILSLEFLPHEWDFIFDRKGKVSA